MSGVISEDPTRQQQRQPARLLEATVLDPVTDSNGWLRVEIAAQPGAAVSVPWEPRVDLNVMPGDAAVIEESDEGNYWCVAWWPQNGQVPTPPGGSVGPATTAALGIVEMSTAPADPAHPIAVSDNDPRNSDPRTPLPHGHAESEIVGLVTDLSARVQIGGDLGGTPTAPTVPALASKVQIGGDLGGTPTAPTVPALTGKEDKANKGVANGYAPLDSGLLVPVANLPTLDAVRAPVANVNLNSKKITALLDPTAAQDAATKNYVDNIGSIVQTPAAGVMARRSADTTIANPSGVVPWNTEDYDTDGFHDNATNPSRFTVPAGKAGKYVVTANVSVSNANTSGFRNVSIVKNGSGTGIEAAVPVVAGDSTRIVATGVLDLAVGDYVEVNLYHNAGAALTVQSAWSQFSMARVPGNNAVIVGPQVPAIGARATVGPGGTQAIAIGGSAHVAFPNEEFDTDNIHSTTVNNTRMTINTAGVYEIDAWVKWNVGTGGFTYISLLKNGAGVGPIGENSATGGHMDISATLSLVPGDYIEIAVANSTAGGLTVDQAALSVVRIPGSQGAGLLTSAALPSSPVDGQEAYVLVDSAHNTVAHRKWRASANRWDQVGMAESVDSGWIAVNNSVSNNYGWAHNLGIAAADLHKWEVRGWFASANPAPATGIHPLSMRGMKVDNTQSVAEGYSNPAWIRLEPNNFSYGIYAPMPVFTFYDCSSGGWNVWNSGYYRFLLRRDPTL